MTIEADSPAKALTAAETLGFPVAMKINSPDITQKSDVGGVRTNIMSAAGVRRAFRELVESAADARPDARIHGVTVEPMVRDPEARELPVGTKRDPVFGPVILFGASGTMGEVLAENAPMLKLVRELGFSARRSPHDPGVYVVECWL